MLIPLLLLSIGALFSGMAFYNSFVGAGANEFFNDSVYTNSTNHILKDYHYVPLLVKMSPFIGMISGLYLAFNFYMNNNQLAARLANQHLGLYKSLLNKWYFDEIYSFIVVRPALRLGTIFWKWGDGRLIDGLINHIALGIIPRLTNFYAKLQSGFLFHYAFGMIIGITIMITWFSFGQ